MFYFNLEPKRRYTPYAYHEQGFTAQECDDIITLAKEKVDTALVGTKDDGMDVVKEIRDSDIFFLTYSEETDWVFQKLASIIFPTNDKWFGFNLSGIYEGIQVARYQVDEEGNEGHYDWHIDSGGWQNRKLSVVTLLSDPSEFEGGNFEVRPEFSKTMDPIKKGTTICFPPFTPHRVTPVTKGERWSMACWVSGPEFV